jgi:hypothetical protein
VPRVNDVGERIEASRNLIPKMLFDNSRWRMTPSAEPDHLARNTALGIQLLLMYRWPYNWPYNPATGTYGASPKHDEASHAADAFGGGAQALEKQLLAPQQSWNRPNTTEAPM